MKKTTTTPIPKEKLHEGFNECQHKIYSLLQSSKVLYNSDQFIESLALSILAAEETTKLSIILDHIKQKSNIVPNEWEELTTVRGMHKIKLTKIQKDWIRRLEGMSDEKYESLSKIKPSQSKIYRMDAINRLQDLEKMYEKLAKIKNECFYVNWNANWSTLSTHIPNQQDQKDLAYYFLILGWYEYYQVTYILKNDVDNSNIEKHRSHPHLQQFLKLRRKHDSKDFLKLCDRVKQILDILKL